MLEYKTPGPTAWDKTDGNYFILLFAAYVFCYFVTVWYHYLDWKQHSIKVNVLFVRIVYIKK